MKLLEVLCIAMGFLTCICSLLEKTTEGLNAFMQLSFPTKG